MKKPLKIISVLLLVFLGIGGLFGGFMLISDPTGQKFGWPSDLLEATSFNSYLIPGIVLTAFLGLLPLAVGVLTILNRKSSGWMIALQAIVLIGWLTVELILNPAFFVPLMHYTFYAIGVILLIVGLSLNRLNK